MVYNAKHGLQCIYNQHDIQYTWYVFSNMGYNVNTINMVYSIHGMQYTWYILSNMAYNVYTVYMVYSIHGIQYTWYILSNMAYNVYTINMVYSIHGIYCQTWLTIYINVGRKKMWARKKFGSEKILGPNNFVVVLLVTWTPNPINSAKSP